MDGWTLAWLLLIVAFLAVEVPGVWHRGATFSEHVWGRWFPERWQRGVFLFFWSGVLGVHFWDAGAHWWSSGSMVAISACGPLAIVLKREGAMFGKIGGFLKKVGGKLWGGVKQVPGWTLRHGPLVAAGLTGLATIWPAGAGVIGVVSGLLNGGTPDAEAGKAFAEFAGALLLLIGSVRKVTSIVKKAGGGQ